MHSEFLQLNTKVDSLRRTLVAVLAKELSPHLRPAHTMAPTPTIVPVITTTVSMSPVVSIAASVSTQVTASFETSLTTPIATVSVFSSHTATRVPSPTVSVSSSPTASASCSPTASASSSPTASASFSPTIFASASPTTSVFSSPTVSASSSPTVFVSASPTNSVSPNPSAQSASLHPPQVINEAAIPIGRDITIDLSGQQLMSLPDLTKVFNKSCSRRNMAANLIRALVDEETRKQSNVSGRGKDMLDPVVVSYVKNMCFQFYPLRGSEKEVDEWGKCIVSIDESSRRLKNKPPKQKQ